MSDPSLALQNAEIAALRLSNDVRRYVGTAIYDEPPKNAPWKRIVVGDHTVLDDGRICAERFEVSSEIRVWSDSVGMPSVKMIASAVRDAILAGITVQGFIVIQFDHETTDYIRAGDGVMREAVLQFRYFLNSTG